MRRRRTITPVQGPYKAGDNVVIAGDTYEHGYPMGTPAVIRRTDTDGDYLIEIDGDPLWVAGADVVKPVTAAELEAVRASILGEKS